MSEAGGDADDGTDSGGERGGGDADEQGDSRSVQQSAEGIAVEGVRAEQVGGAWADWEAEWAAASDEVRDVGVVRDEQGAEEGEEREEEYERGADEGGAVASKAVE